MERPYILAVLLLALTVAACPDHTEPIWPTPEITQIDALDAPHAVAYVMHGALGESSAYVGLALLCTTRGPTTIEVTAFCGAFPGSHYPVQLAVQSPNGTGDPLCGPARKRSFTAYSSSTRGTRNDLSGSPCSPVR